MFGKMGKLKKLKREEVVDCLVALNTQQDKIEKQIDNNKMEIERLFNKGKGSNDRSEQLVCAKRINTLKKSNQISNNRLLYLNSNIAAIERLKDAIDDKEFIKVNKDIKLNEILSMPDKLQKFLTQIAQNKIVLDENLAETLQVFDDFDSANVQNDKIYGENESDNELLAMFELEKADQDSVPTYVPENIKKKIEE